MRACRIILSHAIHCLLVREALTWARNELEDGGAYESLLQRVSDTTLEMRDAIIASAPQTLGFVQQDDRACHTGTTRLVPASGAYCILWHLFLADTCL